MNKSQAIQAISDFLSDPHMAYHSRGYRGDDDDFICRIEELEDQLISIKNTLEELLDEEVASAIIDKDFISTLRQISSIPLLASKDINYAFTASYAFESLDTNLVLCASDVSNNLSHYLSLKKKQLFVQVGKVREIFDVKEICSKEIISESSSNMHVIYIMVSGLGKLTPDSYKEKAFYVVAE